MKRTLLVVFLALLSPVLASAQTTPLDSCPLPASAMRVAYDETFTVSSSAVGFTAATYAPTNGSPKAVRRGRGQLQLDLLASLGGHSYGGNWQRSGFGDEFRRGRGEPRFVPDDPRDL